MKQIKELCKKVWDLSKPYAKRILSKINDLQDHFSALSTKKKIGIIGIAILLLASVLYFILFRANPDNLQNQENDKALLEVNVIIPMKYEKPATVTVKGFLTPLKEYHIKSEVEGTVQSKGNKFEKGKILEKGDVLLSIDPHKYIMMIPEKNEQLARAKEEMEKEIALRDIAIREWDITEQLDENSQNTHLAWRNLKLESAIAAYERALNEKQLLEETINKATIVSPCRALVLNATPEEDSHLKEGEEVAHLVAVDAYLLEASILNSNLRWIYLPENNNNKGSKVLIKQKIDLDTIVEKIGYLSSFSRSLDQKTKMASLRIVVEDPIGLNCEKNNQNIPMLLNGYVSAEIEGKTIDNAFIVPKEAVIDDTYVIIVKNSDTLENNDTSKKSEVLEKREVHVALHYVDHTVIDHGLNGDEKIVIDKLSIALPGTPVHALVN